MINLSIDILFCSRLTIFLTSSLLLPINGIRRNISSVQFSLTVERTRRNDSRRSSPLCEACSRARGFPIISSLETSQSMAFFNPPGMLLMYSGLEIRMPSQRDIFLHSSNTEDGVLLPSLSGLKIGMLSSESNISISICGGDRRDSSLKNCVFVDSERALPDMANMFNCSTPVQVLCESQAAFV